MSKMALVIGAGGGIGAEVAKQLDAGGWDVTATVRSEVERQTVLDAVPAIAGVEDLDLVCAKTVRSRLQEGIAKKGLELVVVCAGSNPCGPLELADLDQARTAFEINTLSCLAIYQGVLSALRATRGRLIFISSMAGQVAMPFIGVYSATKHALEGLADVMRREAYSWGVDVILIEPGGVRTQFGLSQIPFVQSWRERLTADEAALYGEFFEAYVNRLQTNIPLGIEGCDVAAVVVEAAQARKPKARYPVGADAIRLCSAAKTKADADLDADFRQAYGNALALRN